MPRHVHLLDLDPDLGEGLDDHAADAARLQLVTRLERVESGWWRPEPDAFGSMSGLGLLLVEGLAVRRVALAHRAAAELLGPCDLMRPWEDDGAHTAYPLEATFRVIEPISLAVLDHDATLRVLHFPTVVSRLIGRAMLRSRRMVGSLVIAQLTSVDARLHVALWHLADRFGRVTTEGVIVPLRLTHETLGLIVGARRPTVTAALGRLAGRELVLRRADGGWLLCGEPPAELARPGRGTGVTGPGAPPASRPRTRAGG